MEKFIKLVTTAVPLPIENIDTDQIIPARFLKVTDKIGFGNNLFRAVRILNASFNDKKIFIALLIKEFLNSK